MKSISIKKSALNPNITTQALIKNALDTPPADGFTTSEIRNRLKVLDKLENLHPDSTILELEDAEVLTLQAAFKQVRWAVLDPFIVEFETSIS